MKSKKNKQKESGNKTTLPIIIFLITTLISVTLYFYYQKYSNKIIPNVFINEQSYSGFTKQEAINYLENKIKKFRDNGINFYFKDKSYNAKLEELGIKINTEKTVTNAFNYGHKNNISKNLKDYLNLKLNNVYLQIIIEINEEKFANYISKEITSIENLPRNFSYKYDEKNEFIPIQSQTGMIINKNKLKNEILNNIINFKNDPIKINLIKKNPKVIKDKNGIALLHAQNLIRKKITLKYDSSNWEVQKEDLALWIKFDIINNNDLDIKLNKEKLNDYLLTLVPQINREPINAQLEFKNKKVDIFSLGQEGIALQIEKSIEEINKTVFDSKNYEDDSEKEIKIKMIIAKVQPEITIKDIDNMGITALLSTGESNFYGSPKNRRHNIAVGAGKFQGILIGPGDKFSFNEVLGNVGPREGYLPELVIKKGKTIPEYGGGLCQVSTTAFRAAVLAGLEITERKNHAYAVQYYAPQGTDATIYPPHPDLQFINNTPAYILIQTRIVGNKLFFDFYGSNDGRKVKTKGPIIYDKKTDGSMKSVWTQQVYDKNEKLLFEKKFYSVYKSPALYPHKNPLE